MWFQQKKAFPYSLNLAISRVDARLNRLRLVHKMSPVSPPHKTLEILRVAKLAFLLVPSCAPRDIKDGVLRQLDEVCPSQSYLFGRLCSSRPVEVPVERHVFFSAGL
ncbi:hypothetical protein HPB48_014515 [Haemaphysalis longicornis]|uniref:Uncharacterized protein n=1 Tax=Haemaphysalis longicornis TaxID=44386 RepID=A0A9J6GKF6_HAELO|nr:hypothetical protein HPB48_014515 [Haemaphysalis longicornis]